VVWVDGVVSHVVVTGPPVVVPAVLGVFVMRVVRLGFVSWGVVILAVLWVVNSIVVLVVLSGGVDVVGVVLSIVVSRPVWVIVLVVHIVTGWVIGLGSWRRCRSRSWCWSVGISWLVWSWSWSRSW